MDHRDIRMTRNVGFRDIRITRNVGFLHSYALGRGEAGPIQDITTRTNLSYILFIYCL